VCITRRIEAVKKDAVRHVVDDVEYIWRTKQTVPSSLPFTEPHFDLPCHFYNFLHCVSQNDSNINQRCTNILRQVTFTTTLHTVVPNNCGPSVWNLLHNTQPAPRFLENLCTHDISFFSSPHKTTDDMLERRHQLNVQRLHWLQHIMKVILTTLHLQ